MIAINFNLASQRKYFKYGKNTQGNFISNKKQRPELTDEEAKQLLETLETYCELVINYTLKNGGDEEEKLERL